jgi:hypothetical protein
MPREADAGHLALWVSAQNRRRGRCRASRVREHVAAGADEVAVRFVPPQTNPIEAYQAVRSAL